MKLGCILLVLVIGLLALPACAYLSLNGPTGTGNLPTAEIAKGSANLAYDTMNTDVSTTQSWRAAFGIDKSVELSVNYLAASRTTKGAALKYALNEAKFGQTALGFVFDRTSPLGLFMGDSYDFPGVDPLPLIEETKTLVGGDGPPGPIGPPGMLFKSVNTYQFYLVHTQPLIPAGAKGIGVLGTIGLNFTDSTFADGVVRGYASLQATHGGTNLAVDYQTQNSTVEGKAMASLVLRQSITNGISVEAGWTNALGQFGTDSYDFFGGAVYSIGLK